jgi:hypothetical protein
MFGFFTLKACLNIDLIPYAIYNKLALRGMLGMVDESKTPVLVQEIPDFHVNEGGQLELIDFHQYIQNPEGIDTDLRFSVIAENGDPIPRGIMCSDTGMMMGVPAKGTAQDTPYVIKLIAENDEVEALTTTFNLIIVSTADAAAEHETVVADSDNGPDETEDAFGDELGDMIADLKDAGLDDIAENIEKGDAVVNQQKINEDMKAMWEALRSGGEPLDASFLVNRDITYDDIYYLLGRFAHFVVWNAEDFSIPGSLKEITLTGASEQFKVFDRGACMVAIPKSLFDYERGLMDSVMTAKAIAGEAFKRNWNVEFGGFDKMVSAAWVELRCLMEDNGKDVEVKHYEPTYHDYQLYSQLRTGNS